MRRFAAIAAWTAGIVLTLLLAAGIAGFYVVRSDWLREKVRERIIQEAQIATGGRETTLVDDLEQDLHRVQAIHDYSILWKCRSTNYNIISIGNINYLV